MMPPVDSRVLGRSGLTVSPIGLGLAALGRPGYINVGHAAELRDRSVEGMAAGAHRVLDAAWETGIRHVDAARSYGRAEEFLAAWLRDRGVQPGALTVSSKWGYTYTAGWNVAATEHEVKDHSLAALRRQVAESRAILGEHLDLLQIHSATPESGVLDDSAVLDELHRLRAGGLRIGVTVSGPAQGDTVRRALATGVFDTVQATWNLLERSAEPALREAHEAGLGVIIKEAMANGRLTERRPADASAPGVTLLRRTAAELGASVDALALAAALHRPWATVVLSGAATVEQLRSNVAAIDVQYNDAVDDQLRALSSAAGAYWTTRAALPWN
jgi:aryl-alcohol dehydrogenase-like predicted oxidoreductase